MSSGEAFSWEELPDEIKEQIMRHASEIMSHKMQVEMTNEVNHHMLSEWLESMDEQQLVFARNVFAFVYMNPQFGNFVSGLSAGLLSKFGICIGCGKDHDEEIMKMTGGNNADTSSSHVRDYLAEQDTEQGWSNLISNLRPDYILNIKQYGLALIPHKFPRVKCVNCKLEYVSLEDRMLKPPGIDGCHGCQARSAQG